MSEPNQDADKKIPTHPSELTEKELDPVAGGVYWPDGGCIPDPFPGSPFPGGPVPKGQF